MYDRDFLINHQSVRNLILLTIFPKLSSTLKLKQSFPYQSTFPFTPLSYQKIEFSYISTVWVNYSNTNYEKESAHSSSSMQLVSEAAPLTSGWESSPRSLWCWQWHCCGRSWHLWERLWIHWCTWSLRCLRAAAAFAHKLLWTPETASLVDEEAPKRDAPVDTWTDVCQSRRHGFESKNKRHPWGKCSENTQRTLNKDERFSTFLTNKINLNYWRIKYFSITCFEK